MEIRETFIQLNLKIFYVKEYLIELLEVLLTLQYNGTQYKLQQPINISNAIYGMIILLN